MDANRLCRMDSNEGIIAFMFVPDFTDVSSTF